MRPDQYLDMIRRRALPCAVAATLALLLAGLYLVLAPRAYTSAARVFVSIPSQGSVADTSTGVNLTLTLLQSYASAATSDPTIREIKQDLTLPADRPLNATVDAIIEPHTLVLQLRATSRSPRDAQAIANAAVRALGKVLDTLSSDPKSRPSLTMLTEAPLPSKPSSPRVARVVGLGVIGALALGLFVAAAFEVLDRTLRTREDVRGALGVKHLATIPVAQAAALLHPGIGAHSAVAEAFRSLRTSLVLAHHDRPLRTILVTSANPAEGKTTVACNLALALARAGDKVCLVDADLRRPGVGSFLGISAEHGLGAVLTAHSDLEEVIVDHQGMSVIPFGDDDGEIDNPTEYLGSAQFAAMISALGLAYDVVVLDSPPVLLVTDAVLLSSCTDAVITVVRSGSTKYRDAHRFREAFESMGAHLVGFVLNASSARAGEYSSYYGRTKKVERR